MQPFTVPTLCVDTGIDQTVLELRWLELQREVKGPLQLSLDQFFFCNLNDKIVVTLHET